MSAPSTTTIRVSGQDVTVPAVQIGDRTIFTEGRFLKIARVFEEELRDGDAIDDPTRFVEQLKKSRLRADIFTFAQRLSQPQPLYQFPVEWENAAVIPITTYDDWWKNRAGAKTRNVIRKTQKAGIELRTADLTDDFVRGVVTIYNETPIRQGRPFWHYGKGFEAVKHELSHCPEKSRFLGAYLGTELIGFAKLLRKGEAYDFVLILSMDRHRDKYVTNSLIAKGVEVCATEGARWLQYARMTYLHKGANSLSDFKRHNGFEQLDYPRYYIPLTMLGRFAQARGLHHGIKGVLPISWMDRLRGIRAKLHHRAAATPVSRPSAEESTKA